MSASKVLMEALNTLVLQQQIGSSHTIVVEASGASTYAENDILIDKIYTPMGFKVVAHAVDRVASNNDKTISTLMKTQVHILLSHIPNETGSKLHE